MLTKGNHYEIDITDMGTSGEGIGRAEGAAVFVPGAVMGDRCEVEITKVKKTFAFGRLLTVTEPSPYRIEPRCAFAGDCGGCSLAAMSYEGQLQWKEQKVRDTLERIGGVKNPEVEGIVPMEEPLYYRNNGQFPVGGTVEEPAIGFYRARTHEVVDCPDCLLQSAPAVTAAQVIREYMAEYGVTPFDPRTGKGTLRHLVVRNAEGTGEVMVVLVINKGKLPEQEELTNWLAEALAELEPDPVTGVRWKLRCLALNVNQNRGSGSVLGDKTIFLYGQERITDDFDGIRYLISPRSFYQVNTKQAKKLYGTVAEFAELNGSETVFERPGPLSMLEIMSDRTIMKAFAYLYRISSERFAQSRETERPDALRVFTVPEVAEGCGLDKSLAEEALDTLSSLHLAEAARTRGGETEYCFSTDRAQFVHAIFHILEILFSDSRVYALRRDSSNISDYLFEKLW